MASCSRRPSLAGHAAACPEQTRHGRVPAPWKACPSPRAEKPWKGRASPASIPWGAPSAHVAATDNSKNLRHSEKSCAFCRSIQSRILRETYVRVTNVVQREGSRRRCIGGANLSLLGSRNRHAVGSKAQETRESERDTHTVGTPGVPSTYMSGRKQYPQPVVPCVNYVP